MRPAVLILLVSLNIPPACAQHVKDIAMKNDLASALMEFVPALMKLQIVDGGNADYGALRCEHCGVLHTRAAEAVYPFAVASGISGDTRFAHAAVALGDWLIRQQQQDGSWKETPEEWTGTTTDQLLAMVLAFEHLSGQLDTTRRDAWKTSIEKAADYLTRVMTPEFASINYCATTAASLAATYRLIQKPAYLAKAGELARRTVAKMDRDGFIGGEGGRGRIGNKLGVDLGYDMEMSLWGLGYYARLTGDSAVRERVRASLANHLPFIYPDGSMDGSWGIRSNKWTTYGSATSDGCQVLFALFADDDPRYTAAAAKNLAYLRTNVRNGLLGYGPHYWDIFTKDPCIYPTFAKAKNLALSYELESDDVRPAAELPTEHIGWIRTFPTLDVVEVRTENFMATLTAYRYKDFARRSESKYMYRPSGGTMSYLWLKGHGPLQAASQTRYVRWEPMSFPVMPELKSLTPRIEYEDSTGYYTNLFEFDAILETGRSDTSGFTVSASGELRDKEWLNGAAGYTLLHNITDTSVQKTVTLRYRDGHPGITIVEPIIDHHGMIYRQVDDRTIAITGAQREVLFRVLAGDVRLEIGRHREMYRWPYPALKACPIELHVVPARDSSEQTVSYIFTVSGT